MKGLKKFPALLILMMLVCTAACGRKEQNADDMANSMTETSQAVGEAHTDAVLPETETGETSGINGSGLGTTGETTAETAEEMAGGNSTANESSGIIDDAGNAVKDVIDGAGDAVKDAADGVADGVKDLTDAR